jgi:hypothetical protein
MPLDIKTEADKLRTMYKEQKRAGFARILLTGESGSGKTYGARNAPFPVHIDSFDPDGTIGLDEWITKGDIVVDARYEEEDPLKPGAFSLWKGNVEGKV